MNLHHSMRFTNSKITLPFQNSFNSSSSSPCGSKQSDRSQNTKLVDTKSTSNQSRSISNLARFIQRKQPLSTSSSSSSSYLQNEQPDRIESNKDQQSHHLSTSTLSTFSSSISGSSSFNMRNSNIGNRRSEKGTFSSQRLTRRSNTNNNSSKQRSKSRSRTNSFNDSRLWGSGGSSILLRRANTDDAIWSKIVPILSDNRDHRFRRYRSKGYNGNDFDVEEQGLVEIGERLPDRTIPLAKEDIFGRRRGDFLGEEDNTQGRNECQLIEYNQDDCETDGTIEFESVGEQIYEPIKIGDGSDEIIENITMEDIDDNEQARMKHEQEETMKTISKAIELSRGKLRKSANMSRAFKSVIKSGEGLIRKSELISAAMNGDQPKDPSVTILLEPKSMNYNETENDDDESNRQEKGKKNREKKKESEEKKKLQSSIDIGKRGSNSTEVNASTGFSTSMTAKQCAATLETILRELNCKVARYSHEVHEMKNVIRLKVTQTINGSKRSERRTIRIMITVREEDNIRTSVSFRKLPGFHTSRDTQITPLCLEIRDRFQREWPAVVEALYIRLPTPTKNISTM